MITTLLSRMEIYERIRSIRLTKNLTQEYMAAQLNIDVANYGRLERGKAKIDITRLKDIALIFQMSVEELIAEKPVNEKTIQLLEEIFQEIQQINQKLK